MYSFGTNEPRAHPGDVGRGCRHGVAPLVDQCAARASVDMNDRDCGERSWVSFRAVGRLIRVVGIQSVPADRCGRALRCRYSIFRLYARCVRLLLRSGGPTQWDPHGAFRMSASEGRLTGLATVSALSSFFQALACAPSFDALDALGSAAGIRLPIPQH